MRHIINYIQISQNLTCVLKKFEVCVKNIKKMKSMVRF